MAPKKFKMIRKMLGLTQKEMADAIGYESQAMISFIENGRNPIGLDGVIALHKQFGLSYDWMLG